MMILGTNTPPTAWPLRNVTVGAPNRVAANDPHSFAVLLVAIGY